MKILFISNIIGKKVGSFALASIKASQNLDIEYHMAANFNNSTREQMKLDEEEFGIKLHHIDFVRNPLHPQNLIALFQVVKLIRKEKIDAIHCNTPIGGVVGRIAAKICGVKKVIYQAHGFHFYKGAPLKNWLLFYPVERFLAHFTDAIITINHEDFQRAQSFRIRNKGKVYYVPGVGINSGDYIPYDFDRELKRKSMGLTINDISIISAGDLIERKNYKISLEAVAKSNDTKIHYFICGKGPMHKALEEYADQLNIRSQVHFLGFRSDVKELMWASDIFLFSTLQEGLPRALSEAMASGLPCIASKIRGNIDLIEDDVDGYLCTATNSYEFAEAITKLSNDRNLCKQMKDNSLRKIHNFDVLTVKNRLESIYKEELI